MTIEETKKANVLKSIRYRHRHRDKVLAYRRELYKRNPLKFKEASKKYREANKEAVRAYQKELHATMKQSGLYSKYYGTLRCRFVTARSHAKRRELEWNISESDYKELMTKRCDYCDGSLPLRGVGLDRLDNSKGYILGNITPCCTGCNRIKSDQLTFEEMKIAMSAIKQFRIDNVLKGVI